MNTSFITDIYAIIATSAFLTLWLTLRTSVRRPQWVASLIVAASTGIFWELFHGIANLCISGHWSPLHAYGISSALLPLVHVGFTAAVAFPVSLAVGALPPARDGSANH